MIEGYASEVMALRDKVEALSAAGNALYNNLSVTGIDYWAEEENGVNRRVGQDLVLDALEGWKDAIARPGPGKLEFSGG